MTSTSAAAAADAAAKPSNSSNPASNSSARPDSRQRLQVGVSGGVRVGKAAGEERVEEGGTHFLLGVHGTNMFTIASTGLYSCVSEEQ